MGFERVKCTNCGYEAVLPEGPSAFAKCGSCGSTFSVSRARAFLNVELDRTQDVKIWREYLLKQYRLQQGGVTARDFGGVRLFACKILSVLPDDFRAQYYVALADRFADNDTEFIDFLKYTTFEDVSSDEKKEVVTSVVATVAPKHLELVKAFIKRAYPATASGFDEILERNIKLYVQKSHYAAASLRDVFICYRPVAPDKDIANRICTKLEARGLRCWIAPRNILAGAHSYVREIMKGIENSRMFLIVSGANSINSDDCANELNTAVETDRLMLSYRIDFTPYGPAFAKVAQTMREVDASDDPYAHFDHLAVEVINALARDENEKAERAERMCNSLAPGRSEEERRLREQRRIARLENIVESRDPSVPYIPTAIDTRLKRAEAEITSENFDRAEKIIDEVLDADPENPHAWLLLTLCDMRITDDGALVASGRDFTANRYYRNAEKFAVRDPAIEQRVYDLDQAFEYRTVRHATAYINEAERLMSLEKYNEMSSTLKGCANAFCDENSLMFSRFADVASRYFWLKLWAKYGQSSATCVEDITRESEYKLAVKYASPAQSEEYTRQTNIISQNAQRFLSESSRDEANNGKLTDYLADNKKILPVEVYHHYASLLYFRKMLSGLGITEDELEVSAIDIATNESFILAYSLATDGQKQKYDRLLSDIESNRRDRDIVTEEERQRAEATAARKAEVARMHKLLKLAFTCIATAVSYISFIIAMMLMRDLTDEGLTNIITVFLALAVGVLFKILGDCVLLTEQRSMTLTLTFLNIIVGIAVIIIMFARVEPRIYVHAEENGYMEIMPFYVFIIIMHTAGFVLELLKLVIYKRSRRVI